MQINAAHIDSPRLDVKQVPLYEDMEMALLKTHYYGGIKKYQWTAIPLALHGVIIKGDGSTVTVKIGEDDGDPVFCVTDLLPHLATEQMKRSAGEIIKGEEFPPLPHRRQERTGQTRNPEHPPREIRHHREGLPLGRAGNCPRLQGPRPRV